jgi:hypothetical protein
MPQQSQRWEQAPPLGRQHWGTKNPPQPETSSQVVGSSWQHCAAAAQVAWSARQIWQAPSKQTSPASQLSVCSGGHAAASPGQVAGKVATPSVQVAARHWTVLGWNPSAGHPAEVPVQNSATSQTPAAARHSTVDGWNASSGHSAPLPVQNSATSHGPAAGRHSTVAGWRRSSGHWAEEPEQNSAISQGPAAARHSTVFGWKPFGGQVGATPSQRAGRSQGPLAARQTVPAAAGATPQTPATQTGLAAQASTPGSRGQPWSQAPQCSRLVWGSTHSPSQQVPPAHAAPSASSAQKPEPHVWQTPSQAVSQQTPWAQ